ncbi:CAF1-domain-containing protein [Hypoxylon sp. NC1633]|nr:CAF1-domain-containing protein [Hypoxylon sp. NC1633]
MEVNRGNFFPMLPRMLEAAQNARFVAVDVEMSGISSNPSRDSSKDAIQESYTRIKEASEKFQALQIGFTFFQYKDSMSDYQGRTFNCDVSPLLPRSSLADGLSRHLDRTFSISARSYGFLRQHKFDFTEALDNGIHYLSREEQKRAEQFCVARDSESQHIDPLTLDSESQRFYNYVRNQIETFVAPFYQPAQGSPEEGSSDASGSQSTEVIIKNPFGEKLNGLQIRLVHQIVQEEYPMCIAKRISGGLMAGRMSITLAVKDAKVEGESRYQKNMEEINRLSGLQILFEALSGGSFASKINRDWGSLQTTTPKNDKAAVELYKIFDFQQCETNLKKSRPILVGHNLFQDLAFIYRTFFEPLPPQVDDFLIGIHALFPRIVDTKFMYSRGRHMMEPDRTLQELCASYAGMQDPGPKLRNMSYRGLSQSRPHSGGYDSAMTARLFLMQTNAMFTAKKHQEKIKVAYYAPEKPGIIIDGTTGKAFQTISRAARSQEASKPSLLDEEESETVDALQKWDVLGADLPVSGCATPTPDAGSGSPPPSPVQVSPTVLELQDEPSVPPVVMVRMPAETCQARELHIIPSWTDDFWRVYGDKSSMQGAGYVSFI